MLSSLRAAALRVRQAFLGGGVKPQLALGPGAELPPAPVSGFVGPALGPITEPVTGPRTSSPLYPRRLVLGSAVHLCGRCYVGEITGDVQNQLFELKTRLLAIGTYAPTVSTAEQIMNDARLDLKSLPLINKHDVSECIESYVSLLRKVEASDCYFQFLISLVLGDYIELSTNPEKLVEILRSQNVFTDLGGSDLECALETYIDLCNRYCPSTSEVSKNELLEKLENDRLDEMSDVYKNELSGSLFANYTCDIASMVEDDEEMISVQS